MANAKNIYCPRCNHKVATYDGKSKIDIIVKCTTCRRNVVYNIEEDMVTLKKVPKRTQSSGMRFY